MKKNIVIVTWIGTGNYGTSLQSFALHRKLELLGYNVSFLESFHSRFTLKYRVKSILSGFKKNIKKLLEKMSLSKRSLKEQKLADFISTNYNVYKKIKSQEDINKLIANTDVFMTGSDQIWNTAYNLNPFYFLDFAGDSKRVAYASSIGLQDFPKEHKSKLRRMLSRFSYIGLREETAVQIVSKLLNRSDIVQVLDPTFLLDSNDWKNIGNEANVEIKLPQTYILCYLIGNNEWYKQQLNDIISKTGIKNVIIIPSEENSSFLIDEAVVYQDAGPLEFIKLIQKATFVCTDSFHATAISINLNVDFVEFIRFKDSDKASQNSRIYDVLSHYNMMDRIYNEENENWRGKIDFSISNKQLEIDRKKSLDYLINAIEN